MSIRVNGCSVLPDVQEKSSRVLAVNALSGDEVYSCARGVYEVFMANRTLEHTELSTMLGDYKAAVEEWVTTVREEESLASLDPVVAQLDDWERAHASNHSSLRFREEQRHL